MKKLVLAAAIAATTIPAVSSAATTLYGNFRWTVGSFDTAGADTIQAVNNASRLGVKGSVGEKGGLTGFYHLQMGADNDTGGGPALGSRFYFAGIKGGFGKLLLGRASHAYKMAGLRVDPFYDTSAGPGNGGSAYGFSNETNGFKNNTIAYTTPKIAGGLTVNAALFVDDTAADKHGSNVGVAWSANGLTVGAQLLSAKDTPGFGTVGSGSEGTRIHAGYKTKKWSLGVSAEDLDRGTANGEFLSAAGTIGFGAGKLAASYGSVDGTLGGARESAGTGFSVGYFHKLAKKTEGRFIYSSTDYDAGGPGDRDVIGLMLIQSF